MDYNTISEMFLSTTNEFSSKPLYYYKKNSEWIGIKGSDVKATVRNLAAGLRSIGVSESDKVSILSTNSPRWSMSDYGIICNGSVTVTVYPTLLAAQVEYILSNSDSKAVFVENQDQLDKVMSIKQNVETMTHIIVMDDSYDGDSEEVINFTNFLNLGQDYENENGFSLSAISDTKN